MVGEQTEQVFMQKQPSEGFFKKRCYEKFRRIHKKTSVPESFFWCFLVNFREHAKAPFLQNSTGRLLLIVAVSIVAKGVLTKETVNYETKTKA